MSAGWSEGQRTAIRQTLGALAGLVPVGIVAVDAEGRSWYHSQRWEDASGAVGREFRGRPWYEAVHPDDVHKVRHQWEARVERRGSLGTFRIRSRAGLVRECAAESIAMLGAGGSVMGYLVVVKDPEDAAGIPTLASGYITESVLDRSNEVIAIVERDGSWRWSSSAALRLLGHVPEFDPTKGIFQFIHPDEVEEARRAFDRLVREGGQPNEALEYRIKAADGTWRYMEALVDVLLDDPEVQGVVLHARDVTERRQTLQELEAGNQRLTNLVASMRHAVLLEDEEGKALVTNQAFLDLFRIDGSPRDLEGIALTELGLRRGRVVEPTDALERADAVMARREPMYGERVTLADGRIIEFDLVPLFVFGEDRGRLWMYRDVTDQVRAQVERERLLESERAENRRMTELEAHRMEYLASVSHEIRTPLTAIVGYTQILRELLDERGAKTEREYVDIIERNVDRLFGLSGDLLLLDSLEMKLAPLHVHKVSLDQLVQRVVERVGPEVRAKGIRLTVRLEEGPPLHGDPARLEQLIDILASNALKFTEPGGRVTIRARFDERDSSWRVEVADTGMGIPEDEQRLLFSRFYRGSNARLRGIPGTGLSLSIAQAVVHLHGGEITARSEVGTGTTFELSLRCADPA